MHGSAPNSPASPLDAMGEASRRQGGRQNLPESPYATPENGQHAAAPQVSSLEARGEQPLDGQRRADQQAALPESRSAPPEPLVRGDPDGAQVRGFPRSFLSCVIACSISFVKF